MSRFCAPLLLLIISTAIPAAGQAILILPFENQTHDSQLDWIGDSVPEAIAAKWRSADRNAPEERYIIRREERLKAFDDLGLPPTLGVSHATAMKVAELAGADVLVAGDFSGDAEHLVLTARVLLMKQPRLGPTCEEKGAVSALLDLQDRLAMALAASVGLKLGDSAGVGTQSEAAWESYIHGLIAGAPPQKAQSLREAMRQDPAFFAASFQLGKLALHTQDYAGAIQWLAKLSAGDPNYLEASFLTGLACYRLRQWEKAEAAFRAVTEIIPLNEAYNNLGVVQSRRGNRAALESFQKAIEGDSRDADYHVNLGNYYLRAGDYAQAAKRYRDALSEQPEDAGARALLNRALASASGGPAGGEVSDRLKSNYEEPNYRQLQMALARAAEEKMESMSDAEHLAAHIRRGIEFYDKGGDAGADADAIREFREAIRLQPGDARSFLFLARLYARGERTEEAIAAARRAAELSKKDPEPLVLLARIYMEQGKTGEARDALREALDRDPNNQAALDLSRYIMERSVKEKP